LPIILQELKSNIPKL